MHFQFVLLGYVKLLPLFTDANVVQICRLWMVCFLSVSSMFPLWRLHWKILPI